MTKTVYLGLGSNEHDRLQNLETALRLIQNHSKAPLKVSPFYETAAVLPAGAPQEWNKPYFNLVVELKTSDSLHDFFQSMQNIERQCGRTERPKWAPRTIDIDILLWGQDHIEESDLIIPHAQMLNRAFVLDPLSALAPHLRIPGHDDKSVLEQALQHPHHAPLLMGIINATPDSFASSFKGFEATEDVLLRIDEMIQHGTQIIDLGAESTRPGAQLISADEEWSRLEPILAGLKSKLTGFLRPKMSIDTRHPEVAQKAIEWGVDMINDVSGLSQPEMLELAKSSSVDFIAMHNLGLPASKSQTLPEDCDPVETLCHWLEEKMDEWQKAGLNLSQVIFDPGIGFGKTSFQSLKIMQRMDEFHRYGLRVLMGHSRKSFMNPFSSEPFYLRDWETVGASIRLTQLGAHILRVHNPGAHSKAFRAWSHLQKGLN